MLKLIAGTVHTQLNVCASDWYPELHLFRENRWEWEIVKQRKL